MPTLGPQQEPHLPDSCLQQQHRVTSECMQCMWQLSRDMPQVKAHMS